MRAELPNLPLIQERFWNSVKDKEEYKKYKYIPDFEFYMFPQTWGDTSLGFGCMGGQAITTAYTTVIVDYNTLYVGVFFSERLAYVIFNPDLSFYDDLNKMNMVECSKKQKYIK